MLTENKYPDDLEVILIYSNSHLPQLTIKNILLMNTLSIRTVTNVGALEHNWSILINVIQRIHGRCQKYKILDKQFIISIASQIYLWTCHDGYIAFGYEMTSPIHEINLTIQFEIEDLQKCIVYCWKDIRFTISCPVEHITFMTLGKIETEWRKIMCADITLKGDFIRDTWLLLCKLILLILLR